MNELVLPLLCSLIANGVLGALVYLDRKRRKPYRPSAKVPAVGKRLRKNTGELTSTRISRARIGKRRSRYSR